VLASRLYAVAGRASNPYYKRPRGGGFSCPSPPIFLLLKDRLLSAFSLLAQAPVLPVLPATIWHWVAFGTFVAIMLTLDLTVFHKHSHEPTFRESALWTVFWCSLAFVFNGLIWYWARQEFPDDPSEANRIALEFLVGYVVEWSLSMDNVFVFAVIFTFFRVPLKYQYRVLFWGILGAVAMRLTFVLAGAALIDQFVDTMLVFGLLLVYTAYKLAFSHDESVHPENNMLMRFARKLFPMAKESHGDHFFAIENGKRCVTPLFLVLLVIESTDVMFAVDSVPAILGLTKDTFIVFTSNVFAILGLRAMYFMLAGAVERFHLIKYGLALVLVFVGSKMLWLNELFDGKFPITWSLGIIGALIGGAVAASWLWPARHAPVHAATDPPPDVPGETEASA
jgi:tellurite resistance protein TerC